MRQAVVDAVIALGWFLVTTLFLTVDVAHLAVAAVLSVALGMRRWSPGLALAVAWVGAILQMATGQPPILTDLAILPVLYATGLHGGTSVRRLGLVSALVGAVVVTVYTLFVLPGYFGLSTPNLELFGLSVPNYILPVLFVFVASAVMFVLSWTLGLLTRARRNSREARIAAEIAERSVVVEQERNQLARDMHDVVAHSLAVVIAQADGARYTKDPVASADALATISSTAREALTDVRLLLGQLRHSQEAGHNRASPTSTGSSSRFGMPD